MITVVFDYFTATSQSPFANSYQSLPVTRTSAGHAFKSASHYGGQLPNSSPVDTPITPQEAHNLSESSMWLQLCVYMIYSYNHACCYFYNVYIFTNFVKIVYTYS